MSAELPQIECRLCGTLYPETTRFCPNCREPNPEVHEDLLMAARLTGVSYEILLERAWAAEGLVPGRRRAAALGAARETAQPASERGRRGWAPGSVVDRLRRQRDFAVIGCVAVLALVTLGLVAVLLLSILDSGGDDDDDSGGFAITVPATGEAEAPTRAGAPNASPTTAGGSGGGTPGTPTAAPLPLVLEAGQAATYSDGYTASILSYDNQVSALAPTNTPRAAFRFIAVEVQACAGERRLTAGPDDWLIEMPDGAQFEAIELPVQPVLTAGQLAAGACATGWVTFEVPDEPAPVYIVHHNPAYAEVRFTWPG